MSPSIPSKIKLYSMFSNSYIHIHTHKYFSNLLNLLTSTDIRGHDYHRIRIRVHKLTGS